MKRTKRYSELYETNGPASGKKETTIKGLKGIPLTTDNPIITDPTPSDIDDDDTSFSDEEITIELEEPKPPIDRENTIYRKMKRTKKFEEMYENIGPATDSEFADMLKKQGKDIDDEPKKKLSDLEVGDKVWCGGDSGFCRSGNEEITKITTKYDEDSGEPYKVIWIGDRKFDGRHGGAMTPPLAYYIRPL